jgi:Bacteriophage Lambda NinG protein
MSKACKHCGSCFFPLRPLQNVCGPICARRLVDTAKREQRERDKARKEKIKTIPQLIREAQFAFNAFIRARDRIRPCICCGRTEQMGFGLSSHGWDCGHYRSTGSASHLRFNEDNAHRQLVVCNRHGSGRAVDYRIGLIARIGLERVEALEADNTPTKWTAERLRSIKATYKAKLKELQEEESHGA